MKKNANYGILFLLTGVFLCHGSLCSIFFLELKKTVKKKEQ